MGIIELIGLFILKLRYRKKIKEYQKKNPNSSSNEALLHSIDDKKLDKLKKMNKLITVGIILQITVMVIAVLLVVVILWNFMMQLTNIAGLVSMDFYNTPKYDDEGNLIEDGSWSWDEAWDSFWDDVLNPGGATDDDDVSEPGNGSGGAYPKDSTLKLRAQMLEVADECAKATGLPMDGAWLVGVGERESGGGQYRFSSSSPNMFTDLVMTDSVCGKFNGCAWLKGGVSHYSGGTVSGGKDQGSPYTMHLTTDEATYNRFGGDHAIGPFQFEILYVYNSLCKYKYPDSSKVYTNQEMDKDLGFLRPNPLYVPDSLLGNAMMHRDHWASAERNSSVLKSSDFQSLSEKNKNIIRFSLAGSMYGTGGWRAWMDDFAAQLVKVGKTKDLDKLLDESKYWDATNLKINMGSGHSTAIKDFQDAGINWTYSTSGSNSQTHFPWSGLQAVNYGRITYDKLKAAIDSAEKEEGSGGISGGISGNKVCPVNSSELPGAYISSDFGVRTVFGAKDTHGGSDITGPSCLGTPLHCPVDSYVIYATPSGEYSGSYGYHVILKPVKDQTLQIYMAHMNSAPYILVDGKAVELASLQSGTVITAGEVIGNMGKTGRVSGAHLHFEVRSPQDPLQGKPESYINWTNGMGFSCGIPPFAAVFGSNWYSVLENAGIGKGNGHNYAENKTLTWKGVPIEDYFYIAKKSKK